MTDAHRAILLKSTDEAGHWLENVHLMFLAMADKLEEDGDTKDGDCAKKIAKHVDAALWELCLWMRRLAGKDVL